MTLTQRCAIAGIVVTGLLLPSVSMATNGYFLIGFGAKSRSMGGVGVAYGQDGMAAAQNPAAMMDVKKTRVDLALDLFVPRRGAVHISDTLPAEEVSGQNLFPLPSMGGVYKFNRKLRMGMAVVGAGLGTRYDQSLSKVPADPDRNGYFFNFNGEINGVDEDLGVFLVQVQMLPSVAYQFHKSRKWGEHSIGASLALAIQTFRARGLEAFGALGFTESGPDLITGNGFDWSFGAGFRLGWLGKFMKKRLTLGANYSSRVYMTKFEDYSELFAESGSFDIPENIAIGVAFKATDKLTLVADVQKIFYSDIASVNNPGPNAFDQEDFNPLCPGIDPPECRLGGKMGLGFGWTDQTIYKLGANYDHNKTWSFRGGLNYGRAPIPKDQVLFNMLAPATVEWHITAGFSYRPSKATEISVSYVHAFENTIRGPTMFPPTGPVPEGFVDNGSITMKQDSLGIQWGIQI